ncbi:MAG: LamG domain-containing protein [Sedimentisphaerales bacterium]|nr:LamG domain-containing protein [Sedimentisphaerales bacterium]
MLKKLAFFRNSTLTVFVLVMCFLLMTTPVAYGEEAFALEVNGSAVTIDDDEDVLRLSTYTYEFWMKDLQGPTGSWRNVFCKGPGDTNAGRGPLLALRPNESGVHFSHSTGSAQETADTLEGIPQNEWIHIALVLTALDGEQIIYQNGIEMVAESVTSLTDTTQSAVLNIGLGANVVVDDFRIWNYARTQQEIQANMNREATGVEEGLVGYWRFNEGTGNTAYDMSPYENHGTITDAVWISDAAPVLPGKPPLVASRPIPANGAQITDTWASMSWRPGDYAVSHNVYFGDNFEDVNNGTADTLMGSRIESFFIVGLPGYPYPDGLVPGTAYYWRIDEVNEAEPNSPWKGDVWSFYIPSKIAYNPTPADGAILVEPDADLSWTAGFGSKLQTVYFGDNFDDVNNAAAGTLQVNSTYDPDTLDFSKDYYWRVDSFDGITTHKGNVWSFTTIHEIPMTDPNLVGWWTFDDNYQPIVLDQSGYGNHGTLQNDAHKVIGYDGDAVMLDGIDDFVEVPHNTTLTVDNEVTVMAWINAGRYIAPNGESWQGILSKGNSPRSYSLYTEVSQALHFSTNGVGTLSMGTIPLNEWVHVAAMVVGGQHQYYINGEDAGLSGSGITLPGSADAAPVVIGRTQEGTTRSFLGMIDDVRIYNRALTQQEIQKILQGDPTLAWNPEPTNGAIKDIDKITALSFSPGDSATQHDVYFGTDKDAVANADTSDTTGVYRTRQNTTSYTPAEALEWGGGPYYWRIDEINTDGTVGKGRIWSFTVSDYLTVDDMESYNDLDPADPASNRIFNVWLDGYDDPTNGSIIGYEIPPFTEHNIVHSGNQSMPFEYNNAAANSEATLTLPSDRRNWTRNGVDRLVVWYIGDTANAPETMYVVLNGTAGVDNSNPNAAQATEWTEWSVELQAFNVNLANVNTITLGFGNRANPAAGGEGMVFFDDIRLYAPTQ